MHSDEKMHILRDLVVTPQALVCMRSLSAAEGAHLDLLQVPLQLLGLLMICTDMDNLHRWTQ